MDGSVLQDVVVVVERLWRRVTSESIDITLLYDILRGQ
jgi:hypothetical protein